MKNSITKLGVRTLLLISLLVIIPTSYSVCNCIMFQSSLIVIEDSDVDSDT